MKMIRMILFIAMLLGPTIGASAPQTENVKVSKACSGSESWNYGSKWMEGFKDFVSGKSSPLYGFSDALQLKRLSMIMTQADFETDFSEYWVGRVLFELKLDSIAYQAFGSVYDNSTHPQVKKAALMCMGEIQKRSPDLKVPASIFPAIIASESDIKDARDALFLSLLGNMSENNFNFKLASQLPAAHSNLLLGIYFAQHRKYTEAISRLHNFIQSQAIAISADPFLKTYMDQARLFLGRSDYSVKKFAEAETPLQSVTKTSNLVIDAMSDLSWAYLQSDRFDDVIGIAMQLRVGALRNAFAPEATMVAAMAANERCQFPESIKLINALSHDYGPAYEWLHAHQSPMDIYSEVVTMLRKSADPKWKPTVPTKVATEWLKSAAFLNRQLELNALIDHPKQMGKAQERAYQEQIKTTEATLKELMSFLHDVKIAKLKLKPGQELPQELGQRYFENKKAIRKLSRFYRASKTWKIMAKNYEAKIPAIRDVLVKRVNRDLNEHNKELLSQLVRIRENAELIEIEIYNGASHDMIWRNAHPDYEQLVKSVEDEKVSPKSSQVWSWGSYGSSQLEGAEVWEDEVGALKADVSDQCNKKEKYLSLKVKSLEQ